MWKHLLPILFPLLLSGCSYLNKPYWRNEPIVVSDKYTLGIVEFDDQGWFFERHQAQKVLDQVQRTATGQHSVIVVFVHGWHHNARPCDQNLSCFRKTLERLYDEGNLEPYQKIRERMGARSRELKVIGIYIGWRGQSLPGKLKFTSFWDRKAAGHRAGGADVREFFIRLSALQRYLNKDGPGQQRAGLVTIGHSFGGAVIENALSPMLLRPLAENVPITGARDLGVAGPAGPGVYGSSDSREQEHILEGPQVLEGFGDLVVLVNPAFEASLYESFRELAERASYSPCQTPILMSLSTKNDFSRNWLFPFGRRFSLLRQSTTDADQRRAALTAFGNLKTQWTHRLIPEKPEPRAPKATGSCGADGNGLCHVNLSLTKEEQEERSRALEGVMAQLQANKMDPRTIELAKPRIPIRGLVLQPYEDDIDPNLPFLVVRTPVSVINNHSGFFNSRLVGFLISYIGAVETKRLLVDAHPELCKPVKTIGSEPAPGPHAAAEP